MRSETSFGDDLEKLTLENTNYRKVLWSGDMQLVLMSLRPQENIPRKVHPHATQFIKVEKGRGLALVGRKKYVLRVGSGVIIPPGVFHEIRNSSKVRCLKLYTIYTPSEHEDGLIQRFRPKK